MNPIETAPKSGVFLIFIPTTEVWWPAYTHISESGVVHSNAHGRVNDKGDRFSPTATHWMEMPPSPKVS